MLFGEKVIVSNWNFPSFHEINFGVHLNVSWKNISLEVIIYTNKSGVMLVSHLLKINKLKKK